MTPPEVWLRGPIDGVPALLQPVAHSLLQCREEIERLLAGMSAERIWRVNGEAGGTRVLFNKGGSSATFF